MLGKQALKHIAKAIKELDVAIFIIHPTENADGLRTHRVELFNLLEKEGYELTFPHYGLKKVKA